MFKQMIGAAHGSVVLKRRVRVLGQIISGLIPDRSRVLDIGAGDGQIASLFAAGRPNVQLEGIDTFVRDKTHIPVRPFDGLHLPFDDHSFDVVTFVDVLHHADDIQQLLREARRVVRRHIIIKDHIAENAFDNATLRLMDWVGNAPHGVVLPYNYLSHAQWQHLFSETNLSIDAYQSDIPIYPPVLSYLFGRKLHFIVRLTTS